jgi:hypothetical protein
VLTWVLAATLLTIALILISVGFAVRIYGE